jgi:hypothetical protein
MFERYMFNAKGDLQKSPFALLDCLRTLFEKRMLCCAYAPRVLVAGLNPLLRTFFSWPL